MSFLAADAKVPYPGPLPYDKQSVAVPGTKRPGQTAHYRDGIWGLLDPENFGMQTMLDVFASGLSLGRDKPLLGRRRLVSQQPLKFANHYEWKTYGEVDIQRRQVGSAVEHLFRTGIVGGGELETVGIWSVNRPEWQIVDIALQSYRKIGVSLYDTLGKDSVEYIINHAHVTLVFTTIEHIPSLLKSAPKTPHLRVIVSLDTLTPEARRIFVEWGQLHNVSVKDLKEIAALGQANLREPIIPQPSDIASLCYTSGTTGNPKGVVITHRQFVTATITNLLGLELPNGSTLLSYLPLAHIYERNNELVIMAMGGAIGYSTGDPLRLLEDAQILKPHFFPGVPRVLNRVYQAAMTAADVPGLKGDLFRKAYQAKLAKFHATGDNRHFFWDTLVFRKLRDVLGGRVLMISSASAPVSRDVVDFLNVAFSCFITEDSGFDLTYGMTETTAISTRSWPGDGHAGGTIGPVSAAVELKLVDIPAMGYTAENVPNPRGEICVRGSTTFGMYYKDEKNTKEAIDAEGWVHTGDVGEIDACGRFKIIDRVKNIMKLAQGEYVALEKVENAYATCPAIAQLYVHGDGLQAFLIGVVVADPVQLAGIVSKLYGKAIAPTDVAALEKACTNEQVVTAVLGLLDKEAKRSGLKGFETIRRIHLTLDLFTVDEGTLTPTFKLKRKEAYGKFKAQLDALYAGGEPAKARL